MVKIQALGSLAWSVKYIRAPVLHTMYHCTVISSTDVAAPALSFMGKFRIRTFELIHNSGEIISSVYKRNTLIKAMKMEMNLQIFV